MQELGNGACLHLLVTILLLLCLFNIHVSPLQHKQVGILSKERQQLHYSKKGGGENIFDGEPTFGKLRYTIHNTL